MMIRFIEPDFTDEKDEIDRPHRQRTVCRCTTNHVQPDSRNRRQSTKDGDLHRRSSDTRSNISLRTASNLIRNTLSMFLVQFYFITETNHQINSFYEAQSLSHILLTVSREPDGSKYSS